jgi:hypothetical protein
MELLLAPVMVPSASEPKSPKPDDLASTSPALPKISITLSSVKAREFASNVLRPNHANTAVTARTTAKVTAKLQLLNAVSRRDMASGNCEAQVA